MATTATVSKTLGILPRPTAERGFWSWVTTVDHKRIGILYLVTGLIFFVIGGIEAALMRLQLFRPDNNFITGDQFNQLMTMHGLTMIFLAVMPIASGYMNYFLPILIGARDVAFPRLNAFSYWNYLFGAIFLNTGWFLGPKFCGQPTCSPAVGWFGYAPLTEKPYAGIGADIYTLGLLLLGIGSVVSSVNFIVTILNMRAPGMSLFRMPIFVWTTLVTSFLIAFSFPAFTVALIMLMFDRYFATNFFATAGGGNPVLWQHLFWTMGHPEVYILVLPAMGIISEIIPVFAKKPLFGYAVMVFSTVAIGFLGFAVWSHHMFAVGMGPVVNTVFSLTTMAIAIPTGVKIFNWLSTMWGGRLRFTTPMIFATAFIANFTIGGLSGVMHASAPSNAQQTDTYFIVAHFHYVILGGIMMGLLGGLYYWFPKMFGRMMDERLGKWSAAFIIAGFHITFFPFHFLGLLGMPRRIYTYPAELGLTLWNQVSTVGVFVLAFGILLTLVNFVKSLRSGEKAPADPWDGRTLEWTLPSPVPAYNFKEIPLVPGRDPLWLQKLGQGTIRPAFREHHIHMPGPSYMPVVTALGSTAFGYGFLFENWTVAALGLVVTLLGIYGWAFEGEGGYHIEPEGEHR